MQDMKDGATEPTMLETKCPFDVIVITSPDLESSHAVRELIKSSCGDFSSTIQVDTLGNECAMKCSDGTIVISSCDPYGTRIGSGGGTVAAMAEADEVYSEIMQMSSPERDRAGITNAEQGIIGDPPTVLICHAGGESSRCPTQITLGKAWTSLPVVQRQNSRTNGADVSEIGMATTVSNPTSLLISTLSEIFFGVPKGSVVVAASDVLLSFQSSRTTSKTIDFQQIAGKGGGLNKVFGLAVPAPLETAKNHGVFVLEKSSSTLECQSWGIQPTLKVLQKPTVGEMEAIKNPPCVLHHSNTNQESESNANNSEDFMAWIDTGVVTFLPHAAQVLRKLSRTQLRCCTLRGLREMYTKRSNLLELGNEKRQKVSHHESSREQTVSGQSLEEFAQTAALKIDLYSDMLQAMQTGSTLPTDIDSSLRRYLEKRGVDDACGNKAQWNLLYSELSKLELFTCAIPTGSFFHLGTTCELSDFLTIGASHTEEIPYTTLRNSIGSYHQRMRSFGNSMGLVRRSGTFVSGFPTETSGYSTVLNSVLVAKNSCSKIGTGSVIEHSYMNCPNCAIEIGERCLLSGLRMDLNGFSSFHIPPGICLQMLPLKKTNFGNNSYLCICIGVDDLIKDAPVKSIFGMDFQYVMQRSGLTESDIWDEFIPPSSRMLWNAKIHPVLRDNSSEGDGSQVDMSFLNWIQELQTQKEIDLKSSSALKHWKRSSRLSLSEIRKNVDAAAEVLHRRSIPSNGFVENRLSEISEILMNRKHKPCNFDFIFDIASSSSSEMISSISRPFVSKSFQILDSLAVKAIKEKSYDIASRVFMTMLLLLSDLAQSLPVCIDEIQNSTEMLKLSSCINSENFGLDTLESIVTVRKNVLMSYNARSILCFCDVLEKASSAMTKRCISGDNFFRLVHSIDSKSTIIGETVIVTAPARIDLAGGWSDTPPLSYEFGGAVANLAVLVNGKRPLQAKCRLIQGKGILLRTESKSPIDEELIESTEVRIRTLNDFADFHDPHSDCALLKSALIYLGLVSIKQIAQDGSECIQSYLKNFCRIDNVEEVGLEIISCSLLPTGSGMGGSSILGGCVISAIAKCVGISLDCHGDSSNNLIHSVLMLEQLLTTGGGWQDQIGGLLGGLKLGTADVNVIPLQTSVKQFPLAPEIKRELDERLVLLFTGKQRLAKNILQSVLQRWARRSNDIMRTLEGLVKGAHDAIESLNGGDIDALGTCMSEYWQHKKVMAGADSGVEPDVIQKLLAVLTENNVISGGTLCGAGGGGCLAMLATKGKTAGDVRAFIDRAVVEGGLPSLPGFSLYSCEVAEDGIETQII